MLRRRHLLENGTYISVNELAEAEKVNASYMSRILRLTLLAPDIVEAILDGRQPKALQLADLLGPFPSNWEQQKELFG